MHVYHVTTEKQLDKFIGNKFCAPLYTPEYTNLMHKNLHAMHDKLMDGRSLFRFCFFETFEKAQKSYERDSMFWKSKILRFKKIHFSEIGFNWQWDEGFNEGEAHLFWIEENHSDNRYSQAGILFQDIDIMINEKWISLLEYFPELRDKESTAKILYSNKGDSKSLDLKGEGWWRKLVNWVSGITG
ncbi:hypothetical protein [uncultured Shewanella sp.]|uniref:hypothetical protein n=1 Tax=uncultured Shewanella sp. TaxID=173975 RepID=UPI002609DDBD|nr:hypothetical protein [uncultured Shewanella sp.]